nr:MAG TPA: hypothetical protein [Caudoviricetes sp.]
MYVSYNAIRFNCNFITLYIINAYARWCSH